MLTDVFLHHVHLGPAEGMSELTSEMTVVATTLPHPTGYK